MEDKRPDMGRVAELLDESAAANRWTNFGPVWLRLKEHVEAALDLPPERCAVPCASGTHAMAAAAAVAARRAPIRWVTSCYGFRSSVIGPFADARVVDCDRSGLIDMSAIDAIAEDGYGGILATNPFGIYGTLNTIVDFARRRGKPLILDNAAAFKGFDRSGHAGVYECLSFHHTKPYGFGEGGCLILDRELESEATAALDFGYRWSWPGGQDGLSNGKLSEPSAAFILAWQEKDGAWDAAYRDQFRRVLEIGRTAGFVPLAGPALIGSGAYGNVPLLCPHPVTEDRLQNDRLVLRKYYKPLGGGPVGADIYDRIVNVPSHRDVARLSDAEIEEVLACTRG